MADKAKITLSSNELALVCNTDWILTKHSIIKKLYDIFGDLSLSMKAAIEKENIVLPSDAAGAKISKGENYLQLPFVMLDYPRCFNKKDTLAIRTFFWWGNFFSITLQLSGKYQKQYCKNLEENFTLLQQKDYYICIEDDPWHHHFDDSNYVLLKNYSKDAFIDVLNKGSFVKIAKRLPLQQWDIAAEFLDISFNEMIKLLKD